MNRTLTLMIFILGSLLSYAQNSTLIADSAYYDLGTLEQEDTLITHIFEFCNEGIDTLIIRRIEPTCLFTIDSWTTDSIAPDQTASITVTLNTRDLFGNFSKHIYVYGNMPTMRLSLSGNRHALPIYTEEDYTQIPETKSNRKKRR